MFDKISGKADEIRDKILHWIGLNPDGSVLDEDRWEKVRRAVAGIGIAIGTWTISSKFAKILSALGIGDTVGNLQAALGLTIGITGIWFGYKGFSAIVDGNGSWLDWLTAGLGSMAGTAGLAAMLLKTKLGQELGIGGSLTIGLGLTIMFEGIGILVEGIKEKDLRKAVLGAVGTIGGIALITVPFALKLVGEKWRRISRAKRSL